MSTPSNITVSYIGRFPVSWTPGPAPTDAGTHVSSQPQQTDPRFKDFVARRLAEAKNNNASYQLSPVERADRIKHLLAVQHRIEDTDNYVRITLPKDMAPEELEEHYHYLLQGAITDMQTYLIEPWSIRKGTSNDKDDDESVRDAADRRAQRTVPLWYGGRCVLTGTVKPEGCHILPVRAKHADHNLAWKFIRMFWGAKNIRPVDNGALVVAGKENQNILPLTQTAHALSDTFHFALRPVSHADKPSTQRLFLQVVYLRDPNGQRIDTHWNHRRFGGFCDFRRPPRGVSSAQQMPSQAEPNTDGAAIQHGDVYELSTDDPDNYPLPDVRFLQLQYAAHTLMSSMRAVGALRDIFSGTPPDDNGDDDGVPDHWRTLVEEAQDLGILDEDAAARWCKGFAHQAREDAEREARLEAFFRASQSGGDELSGESHHGDDGHDNSQDRQGKGKGAVDDDNDDDLR
ncbi:hypothetical protein SCUCBS95973_007429 [Sporothrix curviconia]|uniref:HNH nuclease domain-containing protein n=1 Tax=Sporothrix curviconia TaxID=1260050 RepID=A0ABP0CF24_9PEZI